MRCTGSSTDTFLHVLIWFPVAYILVWGSIVINRKLHHRRMNKLNNDEIASSADELPFNAVPVYRTTNSPFRDAPPKPLLEPALNTRLSIPNIHTTYCIGPRVYQLTVLGLQMVIALASLVQGIVILKDLPADLNQPTYVGIIQLVMAAVWVWCTIILYIAPASASCSVPIFWTLIFYAHVGSYATGCGFGSDMSHDESIKILEILSGCVLVLLIALSWRNFLGINFIPFLLCIIIGQCAITMCRKCTRSWGDEDETAPESGFKAPLIQNEELLDDGETIVELLIYDLWPSFLPFYIGSYLGAYHTGIAASNKTSQTGPLEYTFECPHGVVARKRGKKPSYVQGEHCRALFLGKTSKNRFNEKIALLRESERFSNGEKYGILSNNCHDFCNQLIHELDLLVEVPLYAESLDKLVGFFVPGGSLQALEKFIISLEGPCETRTLVTLAVGVVLFVFCVAAPAAIVASVES